LGLNSLSFSVFANILKKGYEPDAITFTTLIKGLCLKGEIHKALHFHDKVVAQHGLSKCLIEALGDCPSEL
jgi:pentatricopeptide repeat protein